MRIPPVEQQHNPTSCCVFGQGGDLLDWTSDKGIQMDAFIQVWTRSLRTRSRGALRGRILCLHAPPCCSAADAAGHSVPFLLVMAHMHLDRASGHEHVLSHTPPLEAARPKPQHCSGHSGPSLTWSFSGVQRIDALSTMGYTVLLSNFSALLQARLLHFHPTPTSPSSLPWASPL